MSVKSWRKRVKNCTVGFLIDHMVAGNKIWIDGKIEYSIVKTPNTLVSGLGEYKLCVYNTPERKDFIGVSINDLIEKLEGKTADIEIKED